jgi:hypothetical protein
MNQGCAQLNQVTDEEVMSTSKMEEDEFCRQVLREDLKAKGSTFHQFAQADADIPGRFSAVAHATVVGADPIPRYPAAAAHQHDPCGLEPALGYAIDELEPSPMTRAQATGEPDAPSSPLGVGSPLSSQGDPTSAGDAPSTTFPSVDVQRAGVGSPPYRRRI